MEREGSGDRETAAGSGAQQEARPARGLSYSAMDALVGVAVVFIGLVMMVDNHRIGADWGDEGPQTGYFPFHIGAILCIAGVAVMLKAILGADRIRSPFVTWDRFRLVLAVLVPTGLFVLAMQFLGIYVAATLFIAAFMRVLGRTSWIKTVSVSVGVSAVLFWMFEIQFQVPLPKGPLEALLGY